MKKLRAGKYLYRGYEIYKHGWHQPDRCIWWEAINLETDCVDYHAHTKRHIKKMIDADLLTIKDNK